MKRLVQNSFISFSFASLSVPFPFQNMMTERPWGARLFYIFLIMEMSASWSSFSTRAGKGPLEVIHSSGLLRAGQIRINRSLSNELFFLILQDLFQNMYICYNLGYCRYPCVQEEWKPRACAQVVLLSFIYCSLLPSSKWLICSYVLQTESYAEQMDPKLKHCRTAITVIFFPRALKQLYACFLEAKAS